MSSRPFAPITISYALGITLAYFIPGLPFYLLGCIALLNLLALFFTPGRLSFSCLLILSGVIGYSRTLQVVHPGPYDVSRYVARTPVIIEGVIVSDPEGQPNRLGFQVAVSEVTRWGLKHSVTGKVQVWLRGPSARHQLHQQEQALQYGDSLRLRGRLKRPQAPRPGDSFDYRTYLNRHGLFAVLTTYSSEDVQILDRRGGNPFIRLCLRVKKRLVRSLKRGLRPTDYGILAGLLFSSKSQMSDRILSDFQKSGAFHLLSSSGVHVTILAWLLGMLIQAKGPGLKGRVKALLLIIATIGYSIMAGGRPAVVRSALMTSLYWGASLVRREVDSLNSLLFAGWILLAIHPLYLFDRGFQLSFLAVTGLILLTPLLNWIFPWGEGRKFPRWLKGGIQSFNSSVSATLAVSPLLAYSTKTFSLISPVANLLAIPLAGVAIAGGLFHGVLGLLYSKAQSYTAGIVQVLILIFVKVVRFFGNLPFASQEVSSFSPVWLLVIYLPLFILSSYFYSKPPKDSPSLLEKRDKEKK